MKKNYKCKTIERENNNCYINYLDNKKTRVEHIQQYGLDSVPVQEGRGVIIDTGASDSNKVMVGGGAFHSELKEGETIVYNQKRKSSIKLGDEGKIEIKNKTETLKELATAVLELSRQIKENESTAINAINLSRMPAIILETKVNGVPAIGADITPNVPTPSSGKGFEEVKNILENFKNNWINNQRLIDDKITALAGIIERLLK